MVIRSGAIRDFPKEENCPKAAKPNSSAAVWDSLSESTAASYLPNEGALRVYVKGPEDVNIGVAG